MSGRVGAVEPFDNQFSTIMQQQSTINVPSGNPVRALTGLARQIALPGEYAPERFPSFPALERTAVMGFSQPATLPLPASTEVKLMVARQAAYPAWATQATPSGASYGALFSGLETGPTGTPTLAQFEQRVARVTAGNSAGFGGQPAISGSTTIGWGVPILGRDAGTGAMPWFWVPPGWTLYFLVCNAQGSTVSGVGSNVAVQLNMDYWTAPGEFATTSAGTNTITSGSAGTAITTSFNNLWVRPNSIAMVTAASFDALGYSCFAFACSGTATYTPGVTAGALTVAGAVTTSFYPLVFPAEFGNSQLPWSAARTTASAVLCTNVSQVLNKAGTVLAGRVNPVVNNPFGTTSVVIQSLHPAEKAWLPLETGMYTYCPPSTDMSLFMDYTISTAAGLGALAPAPTPVYRLDNDAMVNLAFLTAGAVTESLAVTASWHLEFRTSSALFQVALSGMTLETLHQAQLALAAAGFFFENPEHKSVLERVTKGVYKIAPAAMAVLHAVNPTAARVIAAGHNAAAAAMRPRKVSVPQAKMKMPTTSARASGMLGVRPAKQKASVRKTKKK